jgi:hypothetical protein
MLTKKFNLKYNATLPFNVGDRYYSQDMIRDFRYLTNQANQIVPAMTGGKTKCILSGGDVTSGFYTFMQINITALEAFVLYSVEIPNSFTGLPPSKTSEDIYVPIKVPALTNIPLASYGTVLDGITINYIKIAFKETNGNTRNRAKAVGNYNYEILDDYLLTINPVVPTNYEICLGTVVSNNLNMIAFSPLLRDFGFGMFDTNLSYIIPRSLSTFTIQNSYPYNFYMWDNASTLLESQLGTDNRTFNLPDATLFKYRKIKIMNLYISSGYTNIVPFGTQKINDNSNFYLTRKSYVELISDGSNWKITDLKFQPFRTGYINCTLWTGRLLGQVRILLNPVGAIGNNVTGDTVTESISGNTGIVSRFEFAGGNYYLWVENITGTGLFTVGRTLTFAMTGQTTTIGATTTNADSQIFHNFRREAQWLDMKLSLALSGTTFRMNFFNHNNGGAFGLTTYMINSQSIQIQTGNAGLQYLASGSGLNVNLTTANWLYEYIITFNNVDY